MQGSAPHTRSNSSRARVVQLAVLLSILLATLAVMSNAGESIHPQALDEGWMGWVQGIISPFGWSKTIDPHSKVAKLQQENKKLEQEIAKLRHESATQGLAKRTLPIKPLVEGSKLDANANKLIKQIEAHFANHDRQQPASEKKERTRNVPADNGMHNVKGSHAKDLDSITRGDRNFEDWERIRIEQSHVKYRAEDAVREQHLAKEHANELASEQAEAKKDEIDVEKLKITRKVPEVIDTHIAAGLSISYCQKMVGVASQDTDAPAEQRASFLQLSSQEQDDIQKYCAQAMEAKKTSLAHMAEHAVDHGNTGLASAYCDNIIGSAKYLAMPGKERFDTLRYCLDA